MGIYIVANFNEWMNSVLRSIDNEAHIGHTYLENNNARWK